MVSYFEGIKESDLNAGVHLSGIGGVGMSALAEILLDLHIDVQGSDITNGTNVQRLKKRGVTIFPSHKKEHIGNRLVCRSRAIKGDNEEIVHAKKSVFRSSLLAFLAKDKKHIVVTGSHGKTTVSTLLSHCFLALGEKISFAVGGYSKSLDRFGAIGSSKYFVIEGDESDGSHLKTEPYAAILTSCDVDHLAFWKNGSSLQNSYVEFANKVQNRDLFLYNGEDAFLKNQHLRGKSYGSSRACDFTIDVQNLLVQQSTIKVNNQSITVPMFGRYNSYNASAVFGLLYSLGFKPNAIAKAIESFQGVYRRMEKIGENIYSDYAHHPEEVKAVFSTMKELDKSYSIIFEPHRISRFKDELDGFCKSLSNVIITDVFEASEGLKIDQTALIEEFCQRTNSRFVPLKDIEHVIKSAKEPILMMGAGALDSKVREIIDK